MDMFRKQYISKIRHAIQLSLQIIDTQKDECIDSALEHTLHMTSNAQSHLLQVLPATTSNTRY